jgi:hypothetical protein
MRDEEGSEAAHQDGDADRRFCAEDLADHGRSLPFSTKVDL